MKLTKNNLIPGKLYYVNNSFTAYSMANRFFNSIRLESNSIILFVDIFNENSFYYSIRFIHNNNIWYNNLNQLDIPGAIIKEI